MAVLGARRPRELDAPTACGGDEAIGARLRLNGASSRTGCLVAAPKALDHLWNKRLSSGAMTPALPSQWECALGFTISRAAQRPMALSASIESGTDSRRSVDGAR